MTIHFYSGERFNKLTIVKKVDGAGRACWLCECDCGNRLMTDSTRLRSGVTNRCNDCARKVSADKRRTLGDEKLTKEYRAWSNMKNRCDNPNYTLFHRYGGRGISVCDSWGDDYKVFLSDMGRATSKEHSIDRIDNNLGYCKENCKWATRIEQANNKGNNTIHEYNGKKNTLAGWCRDLNLNYTKTQMRLQRGMSFDMAIASELPIKHYFKTPLGEFDSLKDCAKAHGITFAAAGQRVKSKTKNYLDWVRVDLQVTKPS